MRIEANPIILSALALVCAAPIALAQPDRAPAPRERGEDRVLSDDQRQEIAQRFIQRRLDQLEAERAKLLEAQQRLEAGDSIEDIRAELGLPDPPRRDARPARRGERGPRGPFADAPPPDHDELLAIVRDIDPRGARRLEGLRERSPERFKRALEDRREDLMQMREDRAEHPELFALKQSKVRAEREMFQTVREHIRSGGSADAQLRDKLRPLVQTQVRADIAIKAYQLTRMEQKLEEARAKVAEHEANPDAAIDERLDEVLRRVSKFRERRERNPEPNDAE